MTHIMDSQHKSESGRFPIKKTQVKWLLQAYLSCINVKKKLIQALDITALHDRWKLQVSKVETSRQVIKMYMRFVMVHIVRRTDLYGA